MKNKVYPIQENLFPIAEIPYFSPSQKHQEIWKRVHIRFLTSIRISKLMKSLKLVKNKELYHINSDIEIKDIMTSRYIPNEESISESNKMPRYMFHPNTGFKIYWNFFMGICLLYTAIVTPFLLAFVYNRDFDIWFVIDIILSGVFLLDFLFTLNTAFNDFDGKLVTNRKVIFLNYLKGWFFIDLVSCFPLDLVQYFVNPNGQRAALNNLSKLARLKSIPRLFRLSKILVLFKNSKAFPFLDSIYFWFSVSHTAVKLFGTLFMIFISLHVVSCLWYFMARFYDFSPDTWIVRKDLQDSSMFDAYLFSLYWALTTLSTIGYGDITPKTTGEILLSMCWMIVAIYFLSFAISSISSMLSQQDGGRKRILDKKLSLIDIYAEENKLPRRVKMSMQRFIKESSEKNLFNFSEKENLLSEFSAPLRLEIAQNVHRGAFQLFQIFQGREERFLFTIIPLMRTENIEKGQYLFMEGEQFRDIFFMIRGKAYFFYKDELKFKVINSGGYCGDIEVVKGVNRIFSVRTSEDSSVWILQAEVFKKFATEFPLFYKEFEVETEKRLRTCILELAEMIAIQNAKKEGINTLVVIRKMITENFGMLMKTINLSKVEQSDLSRIEKKLEACKELIGTNAKILTSIEELMNTFIEKKQKCLT
jgi:CRP-like cAMP-binding protein